ncbi:MAG: transglutaminase family protein [Pirellulaceae bacterium]|nr:transglutaminase family protein [Pirellulaceae bacterium]
MSTILVGCELGYEVRQPTVFLLQIVAARTAHQDVTHEQLQITPKRDLQQYQIGLEGNSLHRMVAQPCELTISYRATVELSPITLPTTNVGESDASDMPPEVLTYLNPSRYCESELLARFAFEEFGQLEKGFGRVQAICDWVHSHLDYTPGSTTLTTTAADVLLQRTGVCRDYAHLAITLCRSNGIPARYVAGYAVDLEPPDFHGFMEAFLDGQWYLFDPTQLAPTNKLIRIGVGRDAADVAFATFTGDAISTEKGVWANEVKDDPPPSIDGDSTAVSTA